MAEPTKKSEAIDADITKMFGVVRKSSIRANICVSEPIGCGLQATEFRDTISKKEYTISGLCQECQDRFFD